MSLLCGLVPLGFMPTAPSVHRPIASRGQRIRLGDGGYSWEREPKPKSERPGSVPNPNQEAMRRLARLDLPRSYDPLQDPLAPSTKKVLPLPPPLTAGLDADGSLAPRLPEEDDD